MPNWTTQQKQAIDTRDKSLLVSAAAGSGKTAVLTQRIIESVLDPKAPIDINRMLIVTFTKAAVGELRDRISRAIEEKLRENPGDARLEKQLYLLSGAKIMTIDAFCNDLLKSFPDAVGISPGYRIADEAEIMIAAREIFEGITESVMRGELSETITAEELDALTDCLADTKKMADVFDLFRKIHTSLRATKDGIDTLLPMVNEYDPESFISVDDTVFGKYIIRHVRESYLNRATTFSAYAGKLKDEGGLAAKYAETALLDAESYTRIANFSTYSHIREAVSSLSYSRIPQVKADEKTPLMLLFLSEREKEKGSVKSEADKFLAYSEEEWKSAFAVLHPLMKTFYRMMKIFDDALFDFKKKRGMFDYTDIERLAYSALVRDGEPSELARSMREEFLAVYIDEYQDVNDLQDSIFKAVSKPDNRFTVGDIKQSIYAFRSANPEIFANAKRALKPLDDAAGEPAAALFMSTNFRSSEGIIKFTNRIFDRAFGALGESIDYTDKDRLFTGRKPSGESFYASPEICVAPKLEINYSIEDDEIKNDDETEPLLPAIVAARIRELIDNGKREDGSPIKASDIAIILRSMKGRSEEYAEALKERGIPTKTSGKKDFFLNSDVLLALCLLNTIDNPLRDVYLTGALRSPIFNFTADELVAVRDMGKGVPFYRALVSYVEKHPEFKKGIHFLKTLARWREVAEGMCTDRLLSSLFAETGILALAEEHGEKSNLIRLYEYARGFEGSSFGGLGAFIAYINNVIANGEKFECNIECADEDAVIITSVHASKGLQYPIVFFADAHRKISSQDTRDKLLVSQGFGAALRHRTPLGLALVDNPMMSAVSERIKEVNLEEELRILYVALTRAVERLYIVGSYAEDDLGAYLDRIRLRADVPSRAAYKKLFSHLEIVLSATDASILKPEEFIPREKGILDEIKRIKAEKEAAKSEKKLDTGASLEEEIKKIPQKEEPKAPEVDPELLSELLWRFSYKYHSDELTRLPEKMSVSTLYPTVLDGTEEPYPSKRTEQKNDGSKGRTVPEFIKGSGAQESRRRGIATHLFMQFFDVESLSRLGPRGELDRLVKEGYLSVNDASRVRLDEIERFAGSELLGRMNSAERLHREFRFNTALPAELFSKEEAMQAAVVDKKILVQGVIDCIMIEKDGSITVIDYKTDRLTKEELENETLAEERLRDLYKNQLGYYSLAVKEIFGKAPSRAQIYALMLGRCIDI